MRSLLVPVLLTSLACGPELHAPVGVLLCRVETPPDLGPLAPAACVPCRNYDCRGPELPPCSVCGDRACLKRGAGWCCDDSPPRSPDADLPVCRPGVSGAPAH